ncbi:MAG: DNA methyltransferase [Armatimonadetes bacterium RBG_16_58_9]|nr:MAG: DNA methyltransferase [Armatimonadetes bacterium RBG_16_58_9]
MRNANYDRTRHAAARTDDYVFNQLIPYIGNKRKLLDMIGRALRHTGARPGSTFLDVFAGTGVVSRLAKSLGYRVIANDWEPYTKAINTCYIACNSEPAFTSLGGYQAAIDYLNNLPPRIDWVTKHLCPRDDVNYDTDVDRMFYMRKNGVRIDAIRHQIEQWRNSGTIGGEEEACLLAPLLYQACYTSNTSGVFKGFHNGLGGQTRTALYRIAGDLSLSPAAFLDNGLDNQVTCGDAQRIAEELRHDSGDVAYLDPPYNQHPYGSNYHVLNSIALWDRPALSKTITPGTKSAIRMDWRTERRSAYNYKGEAERAYRDLIQALNVRFIMTSYSTDGIMPLEDVLRANVERGDVRIEMREYKRYRVSTQRFSTKPVNVEFIIVVDTQGRSQAWVDELMAGVLATEQKALESHAESQTLAEVSSPPRGSIQRLTS